MASIQNPAGGYKRDRSPARDSVPIMQPRFSRGRLEETSSAPAEGERVTELVKEPAFTVEQILSGTLAGPVSYDQAHDEWVLVLEGRARLLVEETELELRAGEWLLLPAGCPHTLLETEPGTNWLALHLTKPGSPEPGSLFEPGS
jgi:cupin 2 domain-containing protein